MAGHVVRVANLDFGGIFALASRHAMFASVAEVAAVGKVDGVGNLSRDGIQRFGRGGRY